MQFLIIKSKKENFLKNICLFLPHTFSKLLLTNGMMLEIMVSCALIRHGHSYSSNQDGYSINK